MHENFDIYQEQQNKKSLLSSKGFLVGLLKVLKNHVELGTGALVVSALLDFFTFALCPPYWWVAWLQNGSLFKHTYKFDLNCCVAGNFGNNMAVVRHIGWKANI